MSDLTEKALLDIGLTAKAAKRILGAPNTAGNMLAVLAMCEGKAGASHGKMLLECATSVGKDAKVQDLLAMDACVKAVVNGGVNSQPKLKAALRYVAAAQKAGAFDQAAFDQAAGVGVDWTPEKLKIAITAVMSPYVEPLKTARYDLFDEIFKKAQAATVFATFPAVKREVTVQIEGLIGAKTAEEMKKKKKKGKSTAKPKKKKNQPAKEGSEVKISESLLTKINSGREIPTAKNTEAWLAKHQEVTGGNIRTRFPPEPNGYLHVGHAKAMNFNFGAARDNGGVCIMRFDDTNPAKEKKEYIDSILANVKWLGHEWFKVTYSSDYFTELYELAIKLIKSGDAFVCHQTRLEIEKSREQRPVGESPYRNRSVEENLKLFNDMKLGLYPKGGATLRVKGDLTSPNPNMWDFIAYRIVYHAHPRTGDAWCIYPSYDYTHCIVDSLEHISHSLCTLEFENRRESYFWLLDKLDLYKPKVWEYSRLNIEHNVLSKRKMIRLVTEKHVRGWNDPRLLTIEGLARRGYTPEALTDFCNSVGISRNSTCFPVSALEHHIREALNKNAERQVVVVDPLKVTITNWTEEKQVDIPVHPLKPELGLRNVPLTKTVYIERKDFAAEPTKKFFGMGVGRTVLLKYAVPVTCTDFKTDATGKVTEVFVELIPAQAKLPKGKLHWVSAEQNVKVELRLYDVLFAETLPGQNPDVDYDNFDWLNELNPDSEQVVFGYADKSLLAAKVGTAFQMERVGYFIVDEDSAGDKLVLNRTCGLKEKLKNKAKK